MFIQIQYDFKTKKNRSVQSTTVEFINSITAKPDRKVIVVGVFIDLRKVLQMVNQIKLLDRLKKKWELEVHYWIS